MIRCRTNITDNLIKSLAKYHTKNKKNARRNKILAIIWALILLTISLINAYGYWKHYDGHESVFSVIIKSSIFVIISIFILYMSIDGSHNIYRKLKQFFTQTNTTFLDYIITEEGLQLIMNGKSSMYHWAQIDNFEYDETYYYFSSNGRHSIIEKEPISPGNRERLENLFENNLKQGTHGFEK